VRERSRRRLALALALCAAFGLSPIAAWADDAAGAVFLLPLAGGVITSVPLAIAHAQNDRVHPALRNIGIVCGVFNTTVGLSGIVYSAVKHEGDTATLGRVIGATWLTIGVVGGGLALAADAYDPKDSTPVVVVGPSGGFVGWAGRF